MWKIFKVKSNLVIDWVSLIGVVRHKAQLRVVVRDHPDGVVSKIWKLLVTLDVVFLKDGQCLFSILFVEYEKSCSLIPVAAPFIKDCPYLRLSGYRTSFREKGSRTSCTCLCGEFESLCAVDSFSRLCWKFEVTPGSRPYFDGLQNSLCTLGPFLSLWADGQVDLDSSNPLPGWTSQSPRLSESGTGTLLLFHGLVTNGRFAHLSTHGWRHWYL